ncbi:MAG: HupE/UreJ family protein [Deltaproteobacteria bacterium]|nr:HupE/UreJ family protein [Deltaproteobacteria bacterium]
MTLAPTLALPTMLGHLGPHLSHDAASAFTEGLLHPLSGLDHLLAMCAIGLLAARVRQPHAVATERHASPFIAPLLTALGLLVGFALGRAGASSAAAGDTAALALGVELAIAGTVLALGLALARRPTPQSWVFAIPLVTFFHGQAHGLEAPPDAAFFALGMTLTSVALVVTARTLVQTWHPRQAWLSATGGAIAVTGLALVLTRL